jgi:hypothetical protein
VVGGWILDERVLEQAVEAKVRGVIAGGVNADLCPFLKSLPFPVVITEGFGTMPMSEQIFSLLQSHVGREAMMSADTRTRWGAKRPEVLIPLRAEEEPPAEESGPAVLQVGDRVRALRDPYLGVTGTVVELPDTPQMMESGARLPSAKLDVGEEDLAVVPLANLELIH